MESRILYYKSVINDKRQFMRVSKYDNIYDKLRKMYYEMIGIDYGEYHGMYSVFVLALLFGFLLLVYSSIVNAPILHTLILF